MYISFNVHTFFISAWQKYKEIEREKKLVLVKHMYISFHSGLWLWVHTRNIKLNIDQSFSKSIG